jgi:tetratricopeptide (TPR) repeat protein
MPGDDQHQQPAKLAVRNERTQMKLRGILFVIASVAWAQHAGHSTEAPKGAAQLLPGMGKHVHPIQTSNPEAQKYFNQGLALIYGFNHEAAVQSFEKAAQLDPKAAMPWWGMAYALGTNYNMVMDAEQGKRAYAAIQKARELAKDGPEHERAYIEAMAKRYSNDSKADQPALEKVYSQAMGELARAYPDDLDAATMYAESMMNLNPWKLWSMDGKPAPGTLEIIDVLESVLRRDPDHPGANHYFIHAVEASPTPGRALPSAAKLRTLVPGAGHLVHMPGHIFIRVGDFESAAATNVLAAEADRKYLKMTGNTKGMYGAMYYTHNLHFIAYSRAEQGMPEEAIPQARLVYNNAKPFAEQMRFAEAYLAIPHYALLRTNRFEDVLKEPLPEEKYPLFRALAHYSRGVAFTLKGQAGEALTEQQAMRTYRDKVKLDEMLMVNKAGDLLAVADAALAARIFEAQGKREEGIAMWRQAVEAEDKLTYMEPPDWYYPVRESLGGALLRAGRADDAEKVFREGLNQHPRNARMLFGLREALKSQKREASVPWVDRELQSVWDKATIKLSLETL